VVLGFLAVLAGAREGWPVVMSDRRRDGAGDGRSTRSSCTGRKNDWAFPSGALLTGLIVAMILNSHSAWYVVAVTSMSAC
jgi:hypothetical protein